VKILVDMNLSPAWCGFLQDAGWEAVHWFHVGDPRAPDAEVMQWALKGDFVLLTHDLDFTALLAATKATGPSVVQVRTQRVATADLVPLLVKIL
jgi:predicted nuclease of predicted toxin-antitoxin system